jgi:putative membrane protein
MTKIQSTLCFLAMASMFGWGCSNNRAATPDANSSQPSSSASSSNSNTTANADQKFVEDAAKGNRAEVELGKMVAAKATNPAVKQFAQRMVKDHTEALNQLQQLAQSKNITLPDGLPSDAQDLQQKLSNDHGKQLDSDYMSGMVEDHEKDVQEFQDAAQNLKDPDLKQWASKTLPILQQHLQMAQTVDSKIKGSKATSSSSGGSR